MGTPRRKKSFYGAEAETSSREAKISFWQMKRGDLLLERT